MASADSREFVAVNMPIEIDEGVGRRSGSSEFVAVNMPIEIDEGVRHKLISINSEFLSRKMKSRLLNHPELTICDLTEDYKKEKISLFHHLWTTSQWGREDEKDKTMDGWIRTHSIA
ncbi:unnamed protein product [Cuscuta campestris]|uniref:Uncharacterized protein n=1 Tax=Cuscuta campestris TaxID=132261 RepID=A0A484KE69_9ASTE|nr:unnamed protein product [Cuscuta campestris]